MNNYPYILEAMQKINMASFINVRGEVIWDLDTNTYMSNVAYLDTCQIDTNIVWSLARPIYKGLKPRKAKFFLENLNRYFSTNLTQEDMGVIYRELCYQGTYDQFQKFVKDGLNMEGLKNGLYK